MSTSSISSGASYMPSSLSVFSSAIFHPNERVLGEVEPNHENDAASEISSTNTLVQGGSNLGRRDHYAHPYSPKIANAALGMACAMCCTFLIMVGTLPEDRESSAVYAFMFVGMGMIEVGLLILFNALESRAEARATTNERRPLLA